MENSNLVEIQTNDKPGTYEEISVRRGCGGSYFRVSAQKPYLPKDGKLKVGDWTFESKKWSRPGIEERVYINSYYKGRSSSGKLFVAKEYADTHYFYWLNNSPDATEEYANALAEFLNHIWVK